MTINECVDAARKHAFVIREDPMLGPMLYARIGAITKRYRAPERVARGEEPEYYTLELLPANRANSVTIADPALVRLATTEEIRDYNNYKRMDPSRPLVGM